MSFRLTNIDLHKMCKFTKFVFFVWTCIDLYTFMWLERLWLSINCVSLLSLLLLLVHANLSASHLSLRPSH